MLSFVTENDIVIYTGGFGFTEVIAEIQCQIVLALIRPSALACISQFCLHEIPWCFC
jgi:hypothetical protein